MSVVIATEDAGPWRQKLTIEVPAPAVEAETGRALQGLRQTVSLPGFRKGKVPNHLIRQRFGEDIRQKVVDNLVPRYWKQAEAEKNLDLLSPPSFGDLKMEKGEPMTFVVTVETRPQIELDDLENFNLPDGEIEPREEEIENTLRDFRRRHAEPKLVDRPAAVGDLVVGTAYDVTEAALVDPSGAPLAGDSPSSPFQVELGADGVDEELTLALTGLAAGQSTIHERTVGEGEEQRDVRHRLEVEEVRQLDLPELDDALAKKISGHETADELRQVVSEQIRYTKQRNLRLQREQALLEQLRERHPLDLPSGAVEAETEQVMQEYASRLVEQGVDLEAAEIDWPAMASQMQPTAERRVHDRLLLDAIAKEKEIRADEAELEAILGQIAARQKRSSLAVRHELSQSGRLQGLKADLLRGQVVRHLLGEDEDDADAAESADPEATENADENDNA